MVQLLKDRLTRKIVAGRVRGLWSGCQHRKGTGVQKRSWFLEVNLSRKNSGSP